MDSFVICIDNAVAIINSENAIFISDQLSLIQKISQTIHLQNNRNRISLMTSSPNPKVIVNFTSNVTNIERALNSKIKMVKSFKNDLVQCFWKGCQELDKVVSLRKEMIIFVKTQINSTKEGFETFSSSLKKDCSPIVITLILFGPKIKINARLCQQLMAGTEQSFLYLCLLEGKTYEEMESQLIDYKLINIGAYTEQNCRTMDNSRFFGGQIPTQRLMEPPNTDDSEDNSNYSSFALDFYNIQQNNGEDSDMTKALQESELALIDSLKDISDSDREALKKAIKETKESQTSTSASRGGQQIDRMMDEQEVIDWFASDNANEMGINTVSDTMKDTTKLNSEHEISRMQERLKTEQLDEKVRVTIEDTLRQTIDSLNALKKCEDKSKAVTNATNNDTEDDLTKALRLSMIEHENNSNPTDVKPMKKKVKKFKEGTKDE